MGERAERKVFRILVVEDHPIATAGIGEVLGAEPDFEIVGNATTEAEAVGKAAETEPDVAIVDITLARGTGLGAIKQLADVQPGLRMLVFTMHDELLYAERAMRAGAHGYLDKSVRAEDLVEAVRTVASGGLAISPAMNDRLVRKALSDEPGANGVDALSDRELEVFESIGRGRTVREIAEALGISAKTVETHRENIKHKLELRSATELARFAVAWVEHPD